MGTKKPPIVSHETKGQGTEAPGAWTGHNTTTHHPLLGQGRVGGGGTLEFPCWTRRLREPSQGAGSRAGQHLIRQGPLLYLPLTISKMGVPVTKSLAPGAVWVQGRLQGRWPGSRLR